MYQRSHPSIICWSMCNEVFFTDAPVKDKAKELIRKMVERSHELDPSRPAAVGGAQRDGFDVLGDLAGYNGIEQHCTMIQDFRVWFLNMEVA